jgi:hypothetical protein
VSVDLNQLIRSLALKTLIKNLGRHIATSRLRRFETPDHRTFATFRLRKFKIPDLRELFVPENIFHEFHELRRFEGDRFS